jgi:hypothetical protein
MGFRTRKPTGPKKVAYRLIDETTQIGKLLYGMLADLLGKDRHDEISDAKVALAWRDPGWKPDVDGRQKLGAPKTPDIALRHLAALELHGDLGDWWRRDEWTKAAKAFGIDVAAVLKAQEKPADKSTPATPGTCRECGCTDAEACEDGCGWADATETLCDRCAQKAKKPKAKKR